MGCFGSSSGAGRRHPYFAAHAGVTRMGSCPGGLPTVLRHRAALVHPLPTPKARRVAWGRRSSSQRPGSQRWPHGHRQRDADAQSRHELLTLIAMEGIASQRYGQSGGTSHCWSMHAMHPSFASRSANSATSAGTSKVSATSAVVAPLTAACHGTNAVAAPRYAQASLRSLITRRTDGPEMAVTSMVKWCHISCSNRTLPRDGRAAIPWGTKMTPSWRETSHKYVARASGSDRHQRTCKQGMRPAHETNASKDAGGSGGASTPTGKRHHWDDT